MNKNLFLPPFLYNMVKDYKVYLFLLSCFILQISLFAQYTLKGSLKDAEENTPIPYVQIRVNCINNTVLSDADGNFTIHNITKDSCEVEFIHPMYEQIKRVVVFSAKIKEIKVNILLQPFATRLEEAKVTASKYETNPEISTNSLVVLQPKMAENKNFVSVDNLINTAGGIVIIDNEPQIRGGSGFSQGMGSRVMIMLDDMPLLRPDAGRPMWKFIPMESIEQVEILKGSASVLFGSAALTGAINVLTAYPRSKPQTTITMFGKLYDAPQNPYQTPWLNTNPVEVGLSFLHSRIIKKNFDLVVGGEVYYDQGYIGPQERVSYSREHNSKAKGVYDKRYRLNFATRYRFEKVRGLSASLNGNFMYSDNAHSMMWFDADTNIFRAAKDAYYQYKEFTFYLDPCVKYLTAKGGAHSLRNRVLFVNSKEARGSTDALTTMVFNEYQYNKTFKFGMNIVAGTSNQYTTSYGPVFNGDGDPHAVVGKKEPSSAFSNNVAIYAQIEQKFFKKKSLTIQLGGRWEFYNLWGTGIEPERKNKPIARVGVNYQIPKSKTAFRASFGQGYRFPTIGEKFISLMVGSYGVFPNPKLRSETSWNAEVGIMQPFQFFDVRMIADVCYFHQDYKNFIEFCLGSWNDSPKLSDRFGLRYLNIGPAKVNGIDFSLMGEGKITKHIKYTFAVSYTWSNPTTKDPAYIYYTLKGENNEATFYSFNNTSTDTTRKVLKYRVEHMVKVDLEFSFFKKFALGGTLMYYGSMKNVDRPLFSNDANNPTIGSATSESLKKDGDVPFYNFYNFFQENKKGSLTLDLRASYFLKNVTLSFIVKNVTNRLYALRPLYIEPPRTFTLQLIVKI